MLSLYHVALTCKHLLECIVAYLYSLILLRWLITLQIHSRDAAVKQKKSQSTTSSRARSKVSVSFEICSVINTVL